MKRILIKMSKWKVILPLFVLFLIFPAYLFPHYQGRMGQLAGQEVIPLDSRFSYNYDEVKNVFDRLGSEGRNTYRFVIAKVDMVFPIVYGALFILVLAWLLKKLIGKESGWILLALFPLIGILFEYLENFNTLSMLDRYPAITEEGVAWGSQVTRLKQIFLIASVAFMPFLAVALLVKSFKRRKSSI